MNLTNQSVAAKRGTGCVAILGCAAAARAAGGQVLLVSTPVPADEGWGEVKISFRRGVPARQPRASRLRCQGWPQ